MPTQICSKCGLEKDIEEFRLRSQFTKRRQSYCIDCGLEMGRDWYQRNKDYQKANARKHRDEYRTNAHEYIWNYLLTHPCVKCGERDPVVLEFHHKANKKETISKLIANGATTQKIRLEIAICDVMCANCHRRLTAEERGWFRGRK